jgi:putative inorganic carbon (HCO3(-)) transporter
MLVDVTATVDATQGPANVTPAPPQSSPTPGDATPRPADTAPGPDRRRRLRPRPLLILGYVLCLGIQLPLTTDMRIAVSDGFVVAYLVVTSLGLRRLAGAWSVWFPMVLLLMGVGMVVSFVHIGGVTGYALFQKGVGLIVVILAMACVMDFADSLERVRLVLAAFVWGVVANAVVGLAALIVQQSDPTVLPMLNSSGVRLAGLDVDPNAFGGLVVCALLVHLLTARSEIPVVAGRRRHLVTLLLAVSLVLTFSRSAWLAAASGMLTAVIVAGRRAWRAFGPLIVTVVAAVPLLATYVLPDLVQLAQRRDQIDSRASIISMALSDFAASPVVGTGLGTFQVRHRIIVHNTTIWMLSELGVAGLLVFIGLIADIAVRLVARIRTGSPAVRTLATALLAAHAAMVGLSMGIEALYQRSWWLLFALTGSLTAMARGRAERRHPEST